jgi:molecular chaperone GrpE (heat shock protein)
MGLEKEKEEIIELTEVLEEGPAFAAKKDPGERLPPNPERKKDPLRPQASSDSLSAFPDSSSRTLKEAPPRETENWAAREGARLVERLAADFIPRIVKEKLSSEVAKFKAETDALRARGEAFSRKLEEWFSSEGLKSLEQKAREEIPRVAAEALHPEIEALKKEIEKIQAQGEELSRRTQSWLESEGKEILEKVARELFPQMAERVLRQEIERLKEESRAAENE